MKQSEKLTQLLELMQANPELPVIPCVDGDVVSGDEYYCWLGSWGESAVQEFVIGRERTYYREDDICEMNDVLYERYDPELVDNMTEEETRAAYNALPWKKAIFVDVHQCEEERTMPEKSEFDKALGELYDLTEWEDAEAAIRELHARGPEIERLYLDSKILPGELRALVMVSNCLEREFIHRQLATGQPLHMNVL